MREHVNDPYVQLARKEGWRSRAAFKLMEMDDKDKLLRRGEVVVDLGATPGGWSQVAAKRVGEGGMVLALDLLEMEPIHGVDFLQGDFREDEVLARLEEKLNGRSVGLVMSDMAPNMSGVPLVDQARIMYLAELGLEFCKAHLKPEGAFGQSFSGDGLREFSPFHARNVQDGCGAQARRVARPECRALFARPYIALKVMYKMAFLSLDAVEGEQA